MIVRKGEVRKVGIEIISQINQDFVIDAASFLTTKADGTIIQQGIPSIDNHKVLTLFTADEIGKFYVEFTCHIGPEILKPKIYVEVE